MADVDDSNGDTWQSLELKRVMDWGTASHINPDAIKVLIKEGFSSMEAISLLEESDMSQMKISCGQKKMVLKALRSLPGNAPNPDNRVGVADPGTTPPADPYVQEIIRSLTTAQAEARTQTPQTSLDGMRMTTSLGVSQQQPPGNASLLNPQMYLASAADRLCYDKGVKDFLISIFGDVPSLANISESPLNLFANESVSLVFAHNQEALVPTCFLKLIRPNGTEETLLTCGKQTLTVSASGTVNATAAIETITLIASFESPTANISCFIMSSYAGNDNSTEKSTTKTARPSTVPVTITNAPTTTPTVSATTQHQETTVPTTTASTVFKSTTNRMSSSRSQHTTSFTTSRKGNSTTSKSAGSGISPTSSNTWYIVGGVLAGVVLVIIVVIVVVCARRNPRCNQLSVKKERVADGHYYSQVDLNNVDAETGKGFFSPADYEPNSPGMKGRSAGDIPLKTFR